MAIYRNLLSSNIGPWDPKSIVIYRSQTMS
jgi:hypothetical protein